MHLKDIISIPYYSSNKIIVNLKIVGQPCISFSSIKWKTTKNRR